VAFFLAKFHCGPFSKDVGGREILFKKISNAAQRSRAQRLLQAGCTIAAISRREQ